MNFRISGVVVIAAFALVGVLGSVQALAQNARAAPPIYSITPLPLGLNSGNAGGTNINAAGSVTGTYLLQNGTVDRGFLWTQQGRVVDLGLPRGITDPTTSVFPSGINARGQIVATVSNPSSYADAFVWDRGSFTLIATQASVDSINDPGQVTGELSSTDHAFLYSHGKVSDLGTPSVGYYSRGEAINNLGHIAGDTGFPAPAPVNISVVPILWMGTEWHVLGLPYAGDYGAFPSSINNYDEIVVTSLNSTSGVMHAFLWKDGAYTMLPCFPGYYCAADFINDAGTIVGYSIATVGYTNPGEVIWFNGQPYDLNMLIDPKDPLYNQVRLIQSSGINANGEILSTGVYTSGPNNGRQGTFVLSPER